MFSDYRLLGDFVEHCQEDVSAVSCGRLNSPGDPGHSQVRFRQRSQIFEIQTFSLCEIHIVFSLERSYVGRVISSNTCFQGRVIDCLMQKAANLTDKCQEEVYKVAEYQGADYHMDRSLFLACRCSALQPLSVVSSNKTDGCSDF